MPPHVHPHTCPAMPISPVSLVPEPAYSLLLAPTCSLIPGHVLPWAAPVGMLMMQFPLPPPLSIVDGRAVHTMTVPKPSLGSSWKAENKADASGNLPPVKNPKSPSGAKARKMKDVSVLDH